MEMRIDSIVVPEGRRPVGDVEELVKSIQEVGLIHPIVVTPDNVLIAGAHRLAACRALGWSSIPVTVLPVTDTTAKMAELDENLFRREGTALERAEWMLERKRLYEALHPSARRGGRREDRDPAFAETTAELASVGRRTVERAVEIAEKIPAEVRDLLRGTGVDESSSELRRLSRLSGDRQLDVAWRIASGQARNVTQAQKVVAAEEIDAVGAVVLPTGPFSVIVADPPWRYDVRADDATHRARLEYPSMSVEEICDLPVRSIAADDCVLWLWCTNAHLRHAFTVLDAWGFEEKTMLTWGKNTMGCGVWLRGKTEHCIVAVRGKPVVRLTNQTTLLTGAVREHSRKPEEFFTLVESLCCGSKVELFARTSRPGWVAYGNEICRFDKKEFPA